MKRITLVSALFAAIASIATDSAAQSADGILYDCDLQSRSRHADWVSGKIGIVVRDSGEVVVTDKITIIYGVRTAAAQVDRNTDSALDIRWTLTGGLREGEVLLPDASYRVRIDKVTGQISLKGRLPGPRANFRGKGTCITKTG